MAANFMADRIFYKTRCLMGRVMSVKPLCRKFIPASVGYLPGHWQQFFYRTDGRL